jgi:hypothetical protein
VDLPPTLSVEFEHPRRMLDLPQAPALEVTDARSLPGFMSRVRVARAVVVVSGALVTAFATQRSGLPLAGATCVFVGMLPVLWFAGWLGGFLWWARRTVRQAGEAAVQAGDVAVSLARQRAHRERVRLEVRDDGLLVARRFEQEADERTVPWPGVHLTRPGPAAALLQVGPLELIELPASAFPDAAAFDAFCLAVQARVWRAQA